MITDEEIKRIVEECGFVEVARFGSSIRYEVPDSAVFMFASEIECISRQHQRESDVAAIPSDKCLEQGDSHADSDRKIVWNNALNEARNAVRNNVGELK